MMPTLDIRATLATGVQAVFDDSAAAWRRAHVEGNQDNALRATALLNYAAHVLEILRAHNLSERAAYWELVAYYSTLQGARLRELLAALLRQYALAMPLNDN